MKKYFLKFFIFILISPAFLQAKDNLPKTIILGADEWCPYNCTPKAKYEGILVEIARQAMSEYNIEVKYILMPWSRAVEQGRSGKIYGIIGASKPDAPDFIYPKTPQHKMKNAFYVSEKNKNWEYKGVKSLENLSLGTVAGYSYGNKELDDYINTNLDNISKIQAATGDEPQFQNIVKLKRGRLDVVIEDENVMNYVLKLNKAEGIYKTKMNLKTEAIKQDLSIAFSPAKSEQSKILAKIISDYTDKIKSNGEYEKLNKKYGL